MIKLCGMHTQANSSKYALASVKHVTETKRQAQSLFCERRQPVTTHDDESSSPATPAYDSPPQPHPIPLTGCEP